MTDFCDMTPAELEKSMADDLYRFIMENFPSRDRDENRERITAYLSDLSQHIEVIAHPPTEAEKALRYSGRVEWRAKTAWGWLEILRMQAEDIEARKPVTITGPDEPAGTYTASFTL